MDKKYKHYFLNLFLPAFVFGSITGIFTALIIAVYKFLAKHVIHFSENTYHYVSGHLIWLLAIVPIFVIVALFFCVVYKKNPDLKGGGIPSSIGILRGLITFKWLRNLIGTFVLSMMSFLLGIPLGNEGPAVMMGTAMGDASNTFTNKKHRVWNRYLMTGGACAGFSSATGAPISGILFAIEEAHQRVSPMIILVSTIAVLFSRLTTEIVAPLLDISISLFPNLSLLSMPVKQIWIALVVGIGMGFFAVIFLKFFTLINTLINKKFTNVKSIYKFTFIMLATLGAGLVSFRFISTGHGLIIELFEGKIAIYMLAIILLIRFILTTSANSSGITGGIFLPTLAIGALMSSIIGKTMCNYFELDHQYYVLILVLGITACIAGMMQMPLTAIVFAIEALGCHNNILFVITVAGITYIITEIFHCKSTNDRVLEAKIESQNKDKKPTLIDTFITVKSGSFAEGKQIRDILWPANFFVLSLTHSNENAEVDEHGGTALHQSDVLHVRFLTYDLQATKEEILDIVGEQEFDIVESKVI